MIHPLTLVTFAAFLGSGLYVFQTKEQVRKLDQELRTIRMETESQRAQTQTLSAEWARLNDQDRLRQMAAAHLRHMQPMEPVQFQRIEDAQRRMPQAVAFAPVPSGFQRRADAPSAPGEVLVFTVASQRREAEPAIARATPPAPAPVAAAPVVAAPPAPVVASPAPAPAMAPIPVALAQPARPAEAPRPAPRPRPEVAALPPIAGPANPRAPAAQAQAQARPAPAAPPVRTALHVQPASTGSLLGVGAGSLPPPVPFNR
ncbi:cell division protein FtsL [Sediminicoccus sp. BL-A-41-H5]|uniref:cell division protein FtsL n=1 Tax=Sediminicoccus sp. BL-A-41-H5 TaxID=3421106 RepID=UPI003D66482C